MGKKIDGNDVARERGPEGLRASVQTMVEEPPQELGNWPHPIGKDALIGLPGDFVKLVEPHTEADPAALLIQFLAAVGNAAGRKPYWCLNNDATRHYTNVFLVLVGDTANGRKGTSWDEVSRVFNDHPWRHRCKSGLSSGEGMIWQVRDPIYKKDEDGQVELVDGGIEDKRLMLTEPEFASVLKVCDRQGNTLSPLIRDAWDRGNLETLTKNSPAKATGAHISIVGHITTHELRRCLNSTESANGFGNRFMWVAVRRSKLLPFGGNLSDSDLADIRGRLAQSLDSIHAEYRRDAKADALWEPIYRHTQADAYGLYGSLCARGAPQIMRLATIYAVCAGSKGVITAEHLRAAREVWRYCEDSARMIFGNGLGDQVADTILEALRSNLEGLTRTEISELFGRNRGNAEIEAALKLLKHANLAAMTFESAGKGRPTERWRAVTKETN